MEGETYLETSRVKKLFKQESFIKVLSVFIAIILWGYVSFVLNPQKQKEFTNVPVRFTNEQDLLNAGLTLVDSNYTANFEVKGRRNIIDSLNKDRIWAEANLSGYTKLGRNRVSLKVGGLPPSVEVVKEPADILIELDKVYSVERNITINIKGETQKGYAVFNPQANPSAVRISGSQKLINSITDVNIIIDVSGLDSNFKTKEIVNIVDSNGNKIKGLKSSVDIIEVSIPIVKAKEVLLKANTKGTPQKNSFVNKITITPQKVLITGNDDLLEQISELNLEPVDLKKSSSDLSVKAKIIIPKEINLINTDGYAVVDIDISRRITKNISIPGTNVQFKDRNPNLDYKVSKDKIDITIEGLEEEINALNVNLVIGNVSVKNLSEGDYLIPFKANLPQNTIQKGEEIMIPINVTTK